MMHEDPTWENFLLAIRRHQNFEDALEQSAEGICSEDMTRYIFEWIKKTKWFANLLEESHELLALMGDFCEANESASKKQFNREYGKVHLEIYRRIATIAAAFMVQGIGTGTLIHIDDINRANVALVAEKTTP